MVSGVAFVPAVPGLAPGAFMRRGVGPGYLKLALQASVDQGSQSWSVRRVRYKSPQRELGDCDVAHHFPVAAHATQPSPIASPREFESASGNAGWSEPTGGEGVAGGDHTGQQGKHRQAPNNVSHGHPAMERQRGHKTGSEA